ncbi:MAG: hypothetical protein IT285_01815 [Bdellovibrionales bacterium]|nr:hypothetical protein [Bdellovibrionales bacterium]
MHFFRVGLTTAALMLASWPWFGWKGVVWYLPVWMAFESVYRLRLRAIMSCSQCGFDPYLYLTGVKRARAAIDAHWRQKFQERGIPFPGDEASSRAEVAQSAGDQKIEARKTTPRVINPKQRAEVQRSLGLDA